MRLLFIICESSVEHRVVEILDTHGAAGHTRFTNATGRGASGRREGTAVWPGLNALVMACVPEAIVAGIVSGLENLQAERGGRLAVKVFSVPVEEYC